MSLTPKQLNAVKIICVGFFFLIISEPVAQLAKGNVSDLLMAGLLLLNPIGVIVFVIGLYRYFKK